jgi:hypothetical protein
MNPWKHMEREMDILRVEDALGSLGFYQSLLQKGLTSGDSIPENETQRFYESYMKGRVVPHLVAPCYSRTVSKEVVRQFNTLFQSARETVAAIIDDDSTNDDLRSKWKSGDFSPGEDYVSEQLLKECVFWYRARQLRMNRSDLTHPEVFSTVKGELKYLMEDMKKFIDAVVGSSMLSFATFLEEHGYRPIDANAVNLNIVTLHTKLGIIVGPPEEDAEQMRDNDNIIAKREKGKTPSSFDPSYM